jgi:phenylpropionate dioxygenase-like ring-hydroxylating dioxygenase large terminal subunit
VRAVDQPTEARIVAEFLALADADATTLAPAARTVPASAYTCPQRFAREQDVLFRRSPVVVGTTADLPDVGDFLACESGGVPILVVRGSDRQLRAYVNACRHRAHPVALGCGTGARRLVCPFHAWTYDADTGRLLGQPRSCGGFETLDPATLALAPIPCVEAHELVIVRPDGDEPVDADRFLHGIGAELDSFDLGSHTVFSRTESVWDCNWKLLVDTFLESYHVPALHGRSLPDQPGHRMWSERFGDHQRIPVPGPTLYEQRDVPREERRLVGHATVQHHLHPNVMLNHVFDYFVMWRFVPLAVDRTLAQLTRYWPTPVDDALRAKLDRRFAWQTRLTAEEDYPVSERIHRSLASGRVTQTVLGRNEAAVIAFHDTVERRLAEAP